MKACLIYACRAAPQGVTHRPRRMAARWLLPLLLSMPGVSISTGAAAETLSWAASVDAAAHNNSELQAARENLRAAEAAERAAHAGYLPQINANIGYSRSNATAIGIASNAGDNYSATLSASENLFGGFQDSGKIAQAQANVRATQASVDIVRARLSYDLKSAYAGLVQAQNGVTVQEAIVRRRQDNLRTVELRFHGGRENKGSVFLSEAYLEQARYDLLQAQHNIAVAQAQMARVLGRADADNLIVAASVPITAPGATPDFNVAVADTPQYRQTRAQEAVAQAGVTIAHSAWYPSLNLTGSSGRQGPGWFPQDRRWSVGVNLSIPLFNGGRDYYGVRSAVATAGAATLTRENSDRALVATLKEAYTAYVESAAKLSVDKNFLHAAETRAEIARNKYNNGLLSFDEWDIIENDLIARQKTLLQSERDRVVNEAAWEQAQGRGAIP